MVTKITNLAPCELTIKLNSLCRDCRDAVVVAGLKQTLRLLADGCAVATVCAQDTEAAIFNQVEAARGSAPMIVAESKSWLGEYQGIAVPCGVACVVAEADYVRVSRRNKRK